MLFELDDEKCGDTKDRIFKNSELISTTHRPSINRVCSQPLLVSASRDRDMRECLSTVGEKREAQQTFPLLRVVMEDAVEECD